MSAISYIESLSSTNSIVDLQNLLNAVQNRVNEIKLEKAAEDRQTVAELIELHGYEALGLIKPKTKKTSSALTRIHKYLNSETGESWPGSGGLPSWILNRDNLELYLNPAWVEHQATKKADKKGKQGAVAVVVESELAADSMSTISANQSALNIDSDDGKLATSQSIENKSEPNSSTESGTEIVLSQDTIAIDNPIIGSVDISTIAIPVSNPNTGKILQAA